MKKQSTGFNHRAVGVAHNHMQGSANCVECGGFCTITDETQSAYTGLIRSILDSEKYNGKIPYIVERFLLDHGIDVEAFRLRRDSTKVD